MKRPKRRARKALPDKGTDYRAVMRLMIRPEGVTTFEVNDALGKTISLGGYLTYIVDFLGYDARRLPNPNRPQRRGTVVYKIVGKDRPGGYRAFSFNSHK